MAASLKVVKQSRSWKLKDSTGSEDLENLFGSGNVPSTKPATCNKYWTLYLCLFGVLALFLFGIVVGFYLRADPKVFNDCARSLKRNDGLDKEKLQAVHNNIMYYMSGDRIAKYNRDLLSLAKPFTDDGWEKSAAKYIEKEFRKFEFDQVEVEKHQVVITSPDPTKPNTLELLTNDSSHQSQNGTSLNGRKQSLQKWDLVNADHLGAFVTFSPSGNITGPIFYGYEGTVIDFLQAKKNHISVNGSLVLLQIGGITVPEKVRNAQRFGAVGVLLFCNHDNSSFHGDCDPDYPYASAADFLATEDERYPRIPVQTVSPDVALSLLKKISGTSQQNVSLADFQKEKTYRNASDSYTVRMEVNVIKSPRTVYNVIGTIHGSDETDREIIIGTGNQVWNQSTQSNKLTNVGILLELANSLNFIKRSQGWKPRRSVKVAFWGGKALSDAGLISYLKNQKHILEEQGVVYIDLDLSNNGQKYMRVETSSSLVSLVTQASLMVPDPGNPDISLADSWPELSHDWYLTNQFPVHNYRKASWYPFLQELGMTSLVVKNVQYDKGSSQLISGESTHHFKYHLSMARVVSHVILQLVDDPKLPFNIDFSLQLAVKSVNDSLNRLKQFMEFPGQNVEPLVNAINQLASVHHQLTPEASSRSCMSALQLRSFNDIAMKLDRVFIDTLPTHSYEDYLLISDKETGTLSVLLDAVNSYLLTGNRDTVYRTLRVLTDSLEQAYTEINTLQTES